MIRRFVDVVVACVGALLLGPVIAVIAGLIRWRMGRPVLFRQARSGLGGQVFQIVKFRTMRSEAFDGEPDLGRLTRLGAALRSTSLDELPQLWNVFRGDMSIIGPRPTLPEQVAQYDDRQRGRLVVRPGVTGWAQVRGRNAISWPDRIELDLWYIAHRSLRLDVRILLLTLRRLLRPEGITGEGGVNPGFPPRAAEGTSSPPGQ